MIRQGHSCGSQDSSKYHVFLMYRSFEKPSEGGRTSSSSSAARACTDSENTTLTTTPTAAAATGTMSTLRSWRIAFVLLASYLHLREERFYRG